MVLTISLAESLAAPGGSRVPPATTPEQCWLAYHADRSDCKEKIERFLTTEPPRTGAVRGDTPRLGTLCNGLCKAGDGIAGLTR